jgi:hypothetical protein
MRIHIDRKQLDATAIAFVVTLLLTIVALAILLSRLNVFLKQRLSAIDPLRAFAMRWSIGSVL